MGSYEVRDCYFKQAKSKGYKSRSAYKLAEIAKKYRLLKKGQLVLDLGAAPGGWSQVVLESIGPAGQLIGIDLQTVALHDPRAHFLQEDIFAPTVAEQLSQLAPHGCGLLLSDMAPSLTGIKFKDRAASLRLVERAWGLAQRFLQAGGAMVLKVFPGEGLSEFKKGLKGHFKTVHEYVPQATRVSSGEIYLVALNKKPGSL